jgi:tetratricopeptide (TPR) repeat protein
MAEVFMALAEQDIRAQPPKIDEATAHWQDAIQAARAIGFESQFLDTLVTTTLARSTTLTQGQHLDEGVALLQAVQPLTDDERVVGKLAELLTDRGVKKGNEQQWDGAVEDLRSALSFNPHSVRARSNLLTALRGAAATAHEAEDTTTARQHLQEARSVLRSGLEMDGDNSGWRQEMIEVEFELLAVEGGSSDGESGGLAALLGGLMAMLGSAQDSTDSAEAMHLMAEAADKAAAQDFAEALRLTERALELDPESPLLLRGLASMTNNYGVQLAEQDQFEQAIQVLQEGVRRFPDHADLQRNLQSVQRADELRRLTSEGSPLEALEALLRVLAEDSGAGVATQPTQEPPRLAPPATGRNRFTELAEAGRAKRERGDLPGAIADLEQALSLAPEHQDIRRSLADTMEKHADALIAQGRRDEGLAVARRGLMYVPDHAGLKMTLALASLGQSGTEGNSTDASAPEAALRTLFEGLARAAASTAGEVQPLKNGPAEPGAAARASVLLQETELKYQERGSNRYVLPFRTEHRDRVVAQLQVVHDLAVVSTPVTAGSVDESALLYSLLRATFTGDYFKACRSSQGQMFLVAETPVGVLSAKSLEEIIRDLVSFADVPDADLTSAERLASHIGSVQAARRMGEGLGASGGGLFGFLRRKSLDESAQRLVEFSRTAGVECQRVADNRYRLKVGLTGLNVLAICKGSAISFIASFGDMRPARGNLRFYRRVTEINMELDVWKIALDSDDDVAFLYELPALDEDTFERMTDGLDQHLMRYGFELTLLARTGA